MTEAPPPLRGEAWAQAQLAALEPIAFPASWSEPERSGSGSFVVKALLHPPGASTPASLVLHNAVVTTPVEAAHAKIEADLEASGCLFTGRVRLPRAQAARRLRFLGCAFEQGVVLEGARLHDLVFGPSADGTPTRFENVLDLSNADIGGVLDCDHAEFRSEPQSLRAERCSIGQAARFHGARFHGAVACGGLRVKADLDCSGSEFRHESSAVSFEDCAVGGAANFTRASVHGGVRFDRAVIADRLGCNEATFRNEDQEVSLNGAKARGVFLRGATFQGPVNGGYAEVAINLEGAGARFQGPSGLSRGRFSRSVVLESARFVDALDLSNSAVGGTLHVFPETADAGAEPPTVLPAVVDLRGLTYDRTDLEFSDHWRHWIALRRAPRSCDPGPYLTLERSFRKAGRDDLADLVHYELRKAEARYLVEQARTTRRRDKILWNWFLRWTWGGWRRPRRWSRGSPGSSCRSPWPSSEVCGRSASEPDLVRAAQASSRSPAANALTASS